MKGSVESKLVFESTKKNRQNSEMIRGKKGQKKKNTDNINNKKEFITTVQQR